MTDKETLQMLNIQRRDSYLKPPEDEDFLLSVNQVLQERELHTYRDCPEAFPTLFVIGVPRSGTTLTAQLIAHSLNVGYMNNFMARFWLAPVTGIKLSKILYTEKHTDFQSHYASTDHITDLHAFGYFWRYWFQMEKLADFAHADETEAELDWGGLRRTLLNIQDEFGKPVVFKNLFGAYYIKRFLKLLNKVVFVYIERDPVDCAISILGARKNYYDDPNLWWSTVPLEYEELKDRPFMEQIAGQVYHLRKLYREQIDEVQGDRIISIRYHDLCVDPLGILQKIRENCRLWFDVDIDIAVSPPDQFAFRRYNDHDLRAEFTLLLTDFENQETTY